MNAALLAACAANARRHATYDSHCCHASEIYYKVKFRKYYCFDAMTIVTPDHESFSYSGGTLARNLMLKPVQLPVKNIVVEQIFPVSASKCTNGIDNYVKDNFECFTSDRFWSASDVEVFESYASEVTKDYNVQVTPGSLSYSTQFYWEVMV